jgi:gliding motility-associated-like protein
MINAFQGRGCFASSSQFVVFAMVLLIAFCTELPGQSTFSVSTDFNSNSTGPFLSLARLQIGEDGQVFIAGELNQGLITPGMVADDYALMEISPSGETISGYFIEGVNFERGIFLDYDYNNGYHAFQVEESNQLPDTSKGYCLVMNFEEEIYWARKTNVRDPFILLRLHIQDGYLYAYQNTEFQIANIYPDWVGICKSELATGDVVWSKRFTPLSTEANTFGPYSIGKSDNGIYMTGLAGHDDFGAISFVMDISESGEVINSIGIKDWWTFNFLNQTVDNAGNLILWGRAIDDQAVILKLSPDFEVLWMKLLRAEYFDYNGLTINTFSDNSLFFNFYTSGDFPIIIGKIDSNGNLLSYQGYSLFEPTSYIGPDNAVYLVSLYETLPDGTKEDGLVIVKADSLGNVAGCPSFDACVELIDFEVETFPLEWTVEDTDPLPMYEVEVEEFDFTTSPYCVTPPPPTPTFTFPDTLCAGACASPDSLNNRLAHQAQWYVQGPGVDTLIADTTFTLCFTEPGEYRIEQEVWLLGCSEIEQHTLTVLPPLQTSFNRTDTICGELPVSLSVQADRVLRDWNWSTGATIPSLPITQSGTYALTVSDGYCADTLSAELTLVAELAEEAVVQLPPEQTICATELPYLLQPFSPYITNFTLLNSGEEGTVFALTEPGTYTVQAEYLGCPFTSTFRLQTSTCANTLYWPNVFSPNADGINDRWAPQSPEHDLTLLQIFDRWGGLVYESRAADAYWDGRGRDGEPATAGVYVGLVRYRHRVSGEEGMEQGEVLLMR